MKDNAIVPFIIEFVCDKDTMKQRLLKRQLGETTKRMDNNLKAIERRIKLFENETQEVINHYKKINKYEQIDATQCEEDVFKSFCKLVGPIAQYHHYYELSKQININGFDNNDDTDSSSCTSDEQNNSPNKPIIKTDVPAPMFVIL